MSSVYNSREKFGIAPQVSVLQHQLNTKHVSFEEHQEKIENLEDVVGAHVLAVKTFKENFAVINESLRELKAQQGVIASSLGVSSTDVDGKLQECSNKITEVTDALRRDLTGLIISAEHKISYVRTEALNAIQQVQQQQPSPLPSDAVALSKLEASVQDNKDVIDIIMSNVSAVKKEQAFQMDFMRTLEASVLALRKDVDKLLSNAEASTSVDEVNTEV